VGAQLAERGGLEGAQALLKPKDVASGGRVQNVGSQGDLSTEATAEFPGDDPIEQPGVLDSERTARTP
jgi:hypothetical protein